MYCPLWRPYETDHTTVGINVSPEQRRIDASIVELERIRQEVEAALEDGIIRAQSIFADVYVDFGGEVSRVDELVANAEFYFSEEGVTLAPCVRAAGSSLRRCYGGSQLVCVPWFRLRAQLQ
jgi:uncharacterized protein (DUF342 family)